MGHGVADGWLRTQDDKVEKIRDAAIPVNKTQLRAFVGLAGYYRRFVPNYAHVAAPLTDLTKKGRPEVVKWSDEADMALQKLTVVLCSRPILHLLTYLGLLRYLHDRRLLRLGQIHVVSSPCWTRGLVIVDDRLSAPMFVQPVLKRQHTRSTDNLFWQTIPHLYTPMWKALVSYIYIVSFFMNFPDMSPSPLTLGVIISM